MSSERGFTLIEVMLALALGCVVVLLAHSLFAATTDGLTDAVAADERMTREANARRFLANLLGSIEVGPGDADFRGLPGRLECTAWSAQPGGWPRPVRVALYAAGGGLRTDLGDETLVLLEDVQAVELDYLLAPGADEVWVRSWRSPASAPVGIRLRVARTTGSDTLLLLVGERG